MTRCQLNQAELRGDVRNALLALSDCVLKKLDFFLECLSLGLAVDHILLSDQFFSRLAADRYHVGFHRGISKGLSQK